MGISIEQIRDQGNLFERAEFGETNGSGDRLSAGIAEYENRLIKYIDYAKIKYTPIGCVVKWGNI